MSFKGPSPPHKLLTRTVSEVKRNWKKKYENNLNCISCLKVGKVTECNQYHLLYCEEILGKNEFVTYIPTYEDLYSDDDEERLYIAKIMLENVKIKAKNEENWPVVYG